MTIVSGVTDCSTSPSLSKRIYDDMRYDNPWQASQSGVIVGTLVCPTTPNGFGFKCTAITTGITGGSEPTWPTTLTNTVVDGGVTWTCQDVAFPSGKGHPPVGQFGYAMTVSDFDGFRLLAYDIAKAITLALDTDKIDLATQVSGLLGLTSGAVTLQSTFPGTIQSGNFHVNGRGGIDDSLAVGGASLPFSRGIAVKTAAAADNNIGFFDSGGPNVGAFVDGFGAWATLRVNSGGDTYVSGSLFARVASGDIGIGTGTANPAQRLEVKGGHVQITGATQNSLMFYGSGGGTDEKRAEWSYFDSSLAFIGRFVNDAYNAAQDFMQVYRNAGTYTASKICFPNCPVGIGTTSPQNQLQVISGSDNTAGDSLSLPTARVVGPNFAWVGVTSNGTFVVTTNDTAAIDVGGNIGFAGRYNGTTQAVFAAIRGSKEDNTAGNFGGYLSFATRVHGGQIAERMRITGSGLVGINTSGAPFRQLDVRALTGISIAAVFGGDPATNANVVGLGSSSFGPFINGYASAGSTTHSNLDIQTSAGDQMTLCVNGGTVGIGGRVSNARVTPAYGVTVTIDASAGNEFVITPNNGVAFTISSPTNVYTSAGQRITIRIRNTTGGALGAVTWGATFKLSAWTNPASGNSRSKDFQHDGSNWIECRSDVDVPN